MACHESGRQRGRSKQSTQAALPALCKRQIWGKGAKRFLCNVTLCQVQKFLEEGGVNTTSLGFGLFFF